MLAKLREKDNCNTSKQKNIEIDVVLQIYGFYVLLLS